MHGTMTIELKQVKFFAHHGLYPEERVIGNDYLVDLSISFLPKLGTITDISDSINYTTLYEITKKEMASATDMLETLAMNIVAACHLHFPQIKSASISIQKLHPPIQNFQGHVGVTFKKEF
jgi:dihydroneopterin aldolase